MLGALFGLFGLFAGGMVISGMGGRSSSEPGTTDIARDIPPLDSDDLRELEAVSEQSTFVDLAAPPPLAARSQSDPANTDPSTPSIPPLAATPPSAPVLAPVVPDFKPAPDQESDAETLEPVVVEGNGQLKIDGGRVTTIELVDEKAVSKVEILNDLEHGNAAVNPDNTIAVVMSGSDFKGKLDLSYKITYANGTTETETIPLQVTESVQAEGWGLGEHYMMAEDDSGDVIVETGDNHRKVFVSESDDALSRSDIAALEGIKLRDVTTEWLVNNPEYGGSEGMALQTDVGMDVWYDILGPDQAPSSHWLLFEAGYEYNDLGRVIDRGAMGESELHPLHVTSWGEGDRPVLNTTISIMQEDTEYVVLTDLSLTGGFNSQSGSNVILSDMGLTNKLMNVRFGEKFTLHDSEISYTVGADPKGDVWTSEAQGVLMKDVDGILLDGNIFHHNAWQDDYLEDGSAEGGMAPNQYSHNVYLQYDTTDVTFRDNITSQAASYGAHLRGGAFAEDNVFLDNNVAVSMFGGNYNGNENVGNFTLFTDNLITSAGYKIAPRGGATSWGMQNKGLQTTWLDNLITHLADPDNPEEFAEKTLTQFAWDNKEPGSLAYDDTIVFNWKGSDPDRQGKPGAIDKNTENVDYETAMNTTIQNFAKSLLGREATIDEMMDYMLSLSETEFDDQVTADDIIGYFQAGFNVATDGDGSATDHRFIPNALGDGVRWDNRLNWNNEETPDAGDTVDLGGNDIQYGGTAEVKDLNFGTGGSLKVNSGKLTVTGDLETEGNAAALSTHGAGQFWTDGYTDSAGLNVSVEGGRFANTGDFTGTSTLSVENNGQAILATDGAKMVLDDDSTLQIIGSEAKVGFDGDNAKGTAVFQMADKAALNMVADADGFSTLDEFRSGAWDQDGSEVLSGVSMDGTLRLDLSAYKGGTGMHELIDVDALDGIFDDIYVYGLGNKLDADIIADYEEDKLLINFEKGTGQTSYDTIGSAGDSSNESAKLWSALTAGQGVYDEGRTKLHDEDGDDMPDLELAA